MKKRMISLFLAGMMALGATGCGKNAISNSSVDLTENYHGKDTEQSEGENLTIGAEDPAGTEIVDYDADAEPFDETYVNFSMEMLRHVSASGENSMISPLSILTALTMTENGAAGETLAQMEQVLAGGTPVEQQNIDLTAYMKGLPDTELCHMNQANSIWVKNTDDAFTVNEAFLQKNAETFDAAIYSAPFDEQTLKDINTWVSEETEGMIPKMLERIEAETVMFLINAVAFEAEWQEAYENYQVREQEFFHADGTCETVDMMYSEESQYIEDENTTGFIKPYKDGYSFVAFLPNEGITMEDYLAGFSAEKYTKLLGNINTDVAVNARLPKFTAEFSVVLNESLIDMGMPLAFEPVEADFSALGTYNEGYDEGNLYISMVLHKTYINVDEMGTKAGAATVVAVDECSTAVLQETKTVVLDCPFVYAIIDNENQLPVFIGVVEKIAE